MKEFSSQFPRAQSDIFKWLLMSNPQSKTHINNLSLCLLLEKTTTTVNPYISEAGTSKAFDIFAWNTTETKVIVNIVGI